MSAALDATQLRADLGNALIGNQIVVLKETVSTNDAVLEFAKRNAHEGVVVFAERQTAGRGRHGNKWESAAGKGLWFSILLRPQIEIEQSAILTNWAATNVAQTIRTELGLVCRIKEPNDVYIDQRKVAGVLVEMRAQPNAAHIAIAGIGLNVNHMLEDFPVELQKTAGSIAMILGKAQDRHRLAVALLKNLDRTYADISRSHSR